MIFGYRRYRQNEMDETRATQPLLYQEIDEHESVKNVFAKELQAEGIIDEAAFTALKEKVLQELQETYDSMKENPTSDEVIKEMPKVLANGIDQFETAVPLEELAALNKGMLQRPEGFNGFKRDRKSVV